MTKSVSKTGNKKRRILSAGAGMVALTAVEGLACGNPVAPRHDMPYERDPDTVAEPLDSADPKTDPSAHPSASASVPEATAPDAVIAAPDASADGDK